MFKNMMPSKVSSIPLQTSSKRGGDKMSATFEAKSEENVPLGDDQKKQLLPDDASVCGLQRRV